MINNNITYIYPMTFSPTGIYPITFPRFSRQALKEEGTTAVSAVFLAPPLAEPKEAEPPSVEEVKPKAMEALRGGWGMPGIFWCF